MSLRSFILTLMKKLPDGLYLRIKYLYKFHKFLHLKNPHSFNEKIQWLKLNDRKPEYTHLVDKYLVKDYVANIIGDEYIIPTIGVWNKPDEIDFDLLPNQFVLKWNHDSGSIVFCKDKKTFNKEDAIKRLKRGEHHNGYWYGREWPYKNVEPKIIAENYLEDESGWQLKDYKIFCFNGEPKFIEVDYDRYVGHKLNVYDLNWKFIDFYMTSPNDKNIKIGKPKKLDLMLELARKLSATMTFVRVDFYSIGEKIYFGELTLSPGSGLIDFHPKEYDQILGDMLELNINK